MSLDGSTAIKIALHLYATICTNLTRSKWPNNFNFAEYERILRKSHSWKAPWVRQMVVNKSGPFTIAHPYTPTWKWMNEQTCECISSTHTFLSTITRSLICFELWRSKPIVDCCTNLSFFIKAKTARSLLTFKFCYFVVNMVWTVLEWKKSSLTVRSAQQAFKSTYHFQLHLYCGWRVSASDPICPQQTFWFNHSSICFLPSTEFCSVEAFRSECCKKCRSKRYSKQEGIDYCILQKDDLSSHSEMHQRNKLDFHTKGRSCVTLLRNHLMSWVSDIDFHSCSIFLRRMPWCLYSTDGPGARWGCVCLWKHASFISHMMCARMWLSTSTKFYRCFSLI